MHTNDAEVLLDFTGFPQKTIRGEIKRNVAGCGVFLLEYTYSKAKDKMYAKCILA